MFKKVLSWFNKNKDLNAETEYDLVGGASYDTNKTSISDSTMTLAKESDAILLGAVGGPKWDKVEYENRPEAGLLRLRKDLDLFAHFRLQSYLQSIHSRVLVHLRSKVGCLIVCHGEILLFERSF